MNDEFKASLGYREKKSKYMVEKLTKISPPKLIKLKKNHTYDLRIKTMPPIKKYFHWAFSKNVFLFTYQNLPTLIT